MRNVEDFEDPPESTYEALFLKIDVCSNLQRDFVVPFFESSTCFCFAFVNGCFAVFDLGREKIEILLWPRAPSRFAGPEAQFSKFCFRTSVGSSCQWLFVLKNLAVANVLG